MQDYIYLELITEATGSYSMYSTYNPYSAGSDYTIVGYEEGVGSSVLGDNVASTSSWSWCSIL